MGDACLVVIDFRFPFEIIVLAMRGCQRYGLPFRDVEELLTKRGIESITSRCTGGFSCFTLLFADAARKCRHSVGGRWLVDET